jgi:hypothetical protein
MTEIENAIEHSVAREFTVTPGPRFISQGPFSGEEFRKTLLEPWFLEARARQAKLLIDLDGGYGYAPSFLEEAFGGLAREYGIKAVLNTVGFKSTEEPLLCERLTKYINESPAKRVSG